MLTPLPGGVNPTPWAHTVAFEKTNEGHLEGKVCYQLPNLNYVVEGAIFDEGGALLSTAVGTVALAGNTVILDFGESPDNAKAHHYLLGFHPAPSNNKDELLLRQGRELALGGTFPVVLENPQFFQSPTDNNIVGRVNTTLERGDENTAVRTVHGVLLSEKGALLSTARASLQEIQEQKVQLNFGVTLQNVTRYQLAVTKAALARQDTLLTPWPSVPDLPGARIILACHTNGQVNGTLTFIQKNTQFGLIPKTYEGKVVVFDAKGELLSSTKTELPGQGGTVRVDLGHCPSARHYQVLLTPQTSQRNEEKIIAGYEELALEGTTRSLPSVTLGAPTFTRSNASKKINARLVASITTAEATDYTFHLALFDEKRVLLDTARSTVSVPKIELGKPLLITRELRLSLRPQEKTPARYQVAVTSVPKSPDADFTVAATHTESGEALILVPNRPGYPMEEVQRNPSLRDYTQIKLTPGVVAALREKGITSFVGKRVQVKGKTERTIYLSFPAVEVTTITVERPDDIAFPWMAQDFLRRLKEAKEGSQERYVLLISLEFQQTLLAAAEQGDEATVIALVQYCWFGGPESATKGGNALTWAAYCPTVEPVKRLLAHGIAPGVADADGNTGLHRTYREEIARLLLEKNAPVDPRNKDGETPLIAQARQCDRWLGHFGVIQALLAKKADPNTTDHEGRTALMYAARSGIVGAVEALLKAGADPKRKDNLGKSAADYAAPWHWQNAPGFATQERLKELERQANADVERIRQLLHVPLQTIR